MLFLTRYLDTFSRNIRVPNRHKRHCHKRCLAVEPLEGRSLLSGLLTLTASDGSHAVESPVFYFPQIPADVSVPVTIHFTVNATRTTNVPASGGEAIASTGIGINFDSPVTSTVNLNTVVTTAGNLQSSYSFNTYVYASKTSVIMQALTSISATPGSIAHASVALTIDSITLAAPYTSTAIQGAIVDINDTSDHSDNITLYNSAGTSESYTNRITARVTNTGTATATFALSVGSGSNSVPTGHVTLDKTSVTLPSGGYTEVLITPTDDSVKADDVQIVATQGATPLAHDSMTVVGVTFGPSKGVMSAHITNADTPAGMPDRIPPRVPTTEYVSVTPDLTGSGESVALTVTGQNKSNGVVTINGQAAPLNFTTSGTVKLSSPDGTTQTAPGYASNLALTVVVRSRNTLQSRGFSVAAIPVGALEIYGGNASQANSHFAGNLDYVTFNSDSGQSRDLDGISVLEQLAVTAYTTPAFNGSIGLHDTSYMNLTVGNIQYVNNSNIYAYKQDANALDRSGLSAPAGSKTWTQYYLFSDSRTGFSGAKVANAGFTWTTTVYQDSVTHIWTVEVAKKGAVVGSIAAGSVSDSTSITASKIDHLYK